MNLNVLKYVTAVAEEGNFTKAAMRLYVAQPSLSQAVRALERDLGTALFDRSGRTVVPTPAGVRFLRFANTVLRSEQKLRAELDAAPGGLRRLAVGASPYRCKALFPEAVELFCARCPGCRIELYDQYQIDAMAQLDEGQIDVAIDLAPAGGYETELIANERILFAIHKSFKIPRIRGGKYPKVNLSDLIELPVVFISDEKYASPLHLGPILRRLYEEMDAVPDIAMQCFGAETAHILAAKGLGFTVIPELFIRSNTFDTLDYCEIVGHPLKRSVCAIWSAGRKLSPDGKTFIELVRAQANAD